MTILEAALCNIVILFFHQCCLNVATKFMLSVPCEHLCVKNYNVSSALLLVKRLKLSRRRKYFGGFLCIVIRMRWAGHVARMGEERWVHRVLLGKPEGTRPLGRPRLRRVDNIRLDHQEVGCGYMDWIGLAQDRDRWQTLVSAVMNLRVP